ncbi:TPA: hypothetical protein V0B45_001211 [Streptococcus pneumoniae]|nr:hypothetical protein [Streptococcus pneumoniae]
MSLADLLEELEAAKDSKKARSSATSKQCFEQSAASFLVCSLIFIEYKMEPIR